MVNVTPITNPINKVQQEYNSAQEILIPVENSNSELNPVTDKVVLSIEDTNNNLLVKKQIYKYTIKNYENTINEDQISSVVVYPERDIKEEGYDLGFFYVYYNFYRPTLNSNQSNYFIKTISPSRTEIRISTNDISNEEIENLVNQFNSILEQQDNLFVDFYVEINGVYYIANNILLDTSLEKYNVLIKLYQPLPSSVVIDTQLQVLFEVAETQGFTLNFPPQPIIIEDDVEYVKGPNFSYQISDQINNSTIEEDYNSLIEATQLTSSYNELENILNQKGITVNIDYTNFDNFIQFSSAEQRLLNFRYKVKQIEDYNAEITELLTITGSTSSSLQVSSSKAVYKAQISDLIKNFDGYENYLYYTSGTLAWPKSNSTQPYTLQSTGSTEVLEWLGSVNESSTYYGGRLLTASLYDKSNQDNLFNLVPTYLSEDPANAGYELFLNMIGQHFDIIYSYINTITDRYNADNRLNYGISKDLVADALRSMGIKLYQNNFSSDNLYSALLGINASGSLLPPTGSEVIETYVTASNTALPIENINKETYKRLYHNLPYLLKKKGTVEGLRALINCFGIPDTILRISEFGGKDKNNSNDWDYFQNKFNYAVYNSGSSATSRVEIPWDVNSEWDSFENVPESVFLRFKPYNILPEGDEYSMVFFKDNSPFYLTLAYTGSSYTSSSYSGSIPSSSNDYATLTLWGGSTEVTHVDAPFYDGNWWGVQFSREGITSNPNITLRAANSIYKGDDGFKIGYTTSSTVVNDMNNYKLGGTIFIPYSNNTSTTLDGKDYYGLTGSFQEIRFYNVTQSEATFHDYVMNPYSIEGINYSSSADNLIFRAPLGSDLNTSTGTLISIHPKISGSYITNSFTSNSDYKVGSNLVYYPQTEFIYYDQPAVGIKNRISEKIRLADNIVPSGDTLTPYRTIQQRYPQSESYTRDVNYVEVAFSPQNEINDDINSSMGYFNIGEYIGDPRQISSSATSYPDLDRLRDSYFDKYYKNYDWTDYIRLIKYFDNSLFKMIKDFTPAKSSLATGVVIKQHLLERNKQRPAQVETSLHDYSGSVYSQQVWDPINEDTYIFNSKISKIEGGTGGIFNGVNNLGSNPEGQSQGFTNDLAPFVTQSWSYLVDTPVGQLPITQSTQDEFYNGELSGSIILASNGETNLYNEYINSYESYRYFIDKNTGDEGYLYFKWDDWLGSANKEFGFQTGSDGYINKIGLNEIVNRNNISGDNYLSSSLNYYKLLRPGDILAIRQASQTGYGSPSFHTTHFTIQNIYHQPTDEAVGNPDGKWVFYVDPIPIPTPQWKNEGGGALAQFELIANFTQLSIFKLRELYDNPSPPPRLSTIFDDIDYATGLITPTNINVIGTNGATKATIPDSNYSQTAWTRGRYRGSRGSSLDFNQ